VVNVNEVRMSKVDLLIGVYEFVSLILTSFFLIIPLLIFNHCFVEELRFVGLWLAPEPILPSAPYDHSCMWDPAIYKPSAAVVPGSVQWNVLSWRPELGTYFQTLGSTGSFTDSFSVAGPDLKVSEVIAGFNNEVIFTAYSRLGHRMYTTTSAGGYDAIVRDSPCGLWP